jgi:hypothetical protein
MNKDCVKSLAFAPHKICSFVFQSLHWRTLEHISKEGRVVATVTSTCVKEEFLSLDVLKTITLLYLVKVCMPSVL